MRKREEDIPAFNPSFKAKEIYSKADRQKEKKVHLGWKWWRIRCAKLKTDPYCERCGLLGEEVHHIHPRATHPELIYDWNNLMTLCSFCHQKEHKQGDFKDG